MSHPVLEAVGLNKRYGETVALDQFSLTIGGSSVTALLGPNGSGKSTFIDVVTGYSQADSGTIRFCGADITRLAPERISRQGIFRTFQGTRLFNSLSLLDNLTLSFAGQPAEALLPLLFRRSHWKRQDQKHREAGEALLARFGLHDKRHCRPNEISFGQRKLLALALCHARQPALIFLDELMTGLSPSMEGVAMEAISTWKQEKRTILMVEHKWHVIERACDRVVFMAGGRHVCDASPQDLWDQKQVREMYFGEARPR